MRARDPFDLWVERLMLRIGNAALRMLRWRARRETVYQRFDYAALQQRISALELELGLREPTATERQIADIVATFTAVHQSFRVDYRSPGDE